MDYFYRNAQAYEVWFCHEGNGVFKSQFGNLPFESGDYIVIPFGTTWQMHLTTPEARFFVIEAPSQIEPPKRYRNKYGQLLEHAPYCERDIRVPMELETHTERGDEAPVGDERARERRSQRALRFHTPELGPASASTLSERRKPASWRLADLSQVTEFMRAAPTAPSPTPPLVKSWRIDVSVSAKSSLRDHSCCNSLAIPICVLAQEWRRLSLPHRA